MGKNGAEALSSATTEQFAKLVGAEAARYSKIVKALGIKLD